MRVVHREFCQYFSNYNYFAEKLRRAIDTYYLPLGEDIQEVIANFVSIQMKRSFSCNDVFNRAFLALYFDEEEVRISYSSTSNTKVNVKFYFDSQMKFTSGLITVDIPDDRAVPGRRHYEEITREFYEFSWNLGSPPPEGVDENALYPEWVLDKASNKTPHDKRHEEMKQLGYESFQQKGFLSAWVHKGEKGEVKYNLIVESQKNEYKLLKEQDLFASSYTVFSWRRLMEVLRLHNQPKADYEDEEHDYVDCEDDYVDCDDNDDEE